LTDGIKARFECTTEITVPRVDEINVYLFKRRFFETAKSLLDDGWREKEGV